MVKILLTLLVLSLLFAGCSGPSKETKIKCPKCGAFFTTKEGVEEFEKMRGL
jgi:PBP1b-binding outer membrane lipoprotein LpoB